MNKTLYFLYYTIFINLIFDYYCIIWKTKLNWWIKWSEKTLWKLHKSNKSRMKLTYLKIFVEILKEYWKKKILNDIQINKINELIIKLHE